MTDKKPPETDPEQSEKFRKAVRDLEAAGELNHTDAEAALEQILSPKPTKPQSA